MPVTTPPGIVRWVCCGHIAVLNSPSPREIMPMWQRPSIPARKWTPYEVCAIEGLSSYYTFCESSQVNHTRRRGHGPKPINAAVVRKWDGHDYGPPARQYCSPMGLSPIHLSPLMTTMTDASSRACSIVRRVFARFSAHMPPNTVP